MQVGHWLLLGLLVVSGCPPDQAALSPFSMGDTSRGGPPAAQWAQPSQLAGVATRDFAQVDAHALRAPATAERSLDALAAYLAGPARDDVDKARAIYRWITARIGYDLRGYESGRFRHVQRSAQDVLRDRKAVCDGYAVLFEALAERMGLQAVVIHGYGKGYGYRAGEALRGPPNHAWNAVRLDGAWYLLDATWGAGTLDARTHTFHRHFEPLEFLAPPERFVYRHLPEQSGWQMLAQQLTPEQFAALPMVWPPFFRDRLALRQPREGVLHADGELTVPIGAPPDVRLTARLLRNGRPVAGGPTLVEREGAKVLIHVRPPRPGDYALQVLSKKEPTETLYESALELRVLASAGVGGGEGFPEVYRPFAERAGRLETPRRGRLPAGTEQHFRLRIPGAVQVVAALRGRLVDLTRQGDAFEGQLRVPRGPLLVYARFPGDPAYAGLLRFEGY